MKEEIDCFSQANKKDIFYECEICHEPISNPICPRCLTYEIGIWATLYPNIRRELLNRLKKYLKTIGKESGGLGSVQCIRCNKKEMPICAYCFINYVLTELEDIGVNKIIKKEFLQFFNYDLGHTPYSYLPLPLS